MSASGRLFAEMRYLEDGYNDGLNRYLDEYYSDDSPAAMPSESPTKPPKEVTPVKKRRIQNKYYEAVMWNGACWRQIACGWTRKDHAHTWARKNRKQHKGLISIRPMSN